MGICSSTESFAGDRASTAEEKYGAASAALISREVKVISVRDKLAISHYHASSQAAKASPLQPQLEKPVLPKPVSSSDATSVDEPRSSSFTTNAGVQELEDSGATLTAELATRRFELVTDSPTGERTVRQTPAKTLPPTDEDPLSSKEERNAAIAENANLRKHLLLKSGSLAAATRELNELRCHNEELVNEKAGLARELESTKRKLQTKQDAVLTLTQEKNNVKADLEELSDVKQKLADVQKKHDALQSERQTMESSVGRNNRVDCDQGGTNRFRDTEEPVLFSCSPRDIRIKVCEWKHEIKVDIREYYPGGETKKGVQLLVREAEALADLLAEAIREAKLRE